MTPRTFAIGDLHGELTHLETLLARLPALTEADTLVFLGDYIDRGPDSLGVVERLMALPSQTPAKIICLRGNHEDAWLRVRREGWDEFVFPAAHGCLAALRSFEKTASTLGNQPASSAEQQRLSTGEFFPERVAAWMEALPYWYEDAHGLYVHAGLPRKNESAFTHPADVRQPHMLAWLRTDDFVKNYRGKNVFFGHTPTGLLPQDLSLHTPDDPSDMFEAEDCFGLDTGCGLGGFLTCIELPSMQVYETRQRTEKY